PLNVTRGTSSLRDGGWKARARSCDFGRLVAKGAAVNKGDFDVSSDQHFRAAQSTYNGFVGMFKWGAIACAVVAALVILLISQ
ncbi:MAG: aa3-type cytochrome c oxidase subunit IV, partial [Sphingobium sp.]